MNALAVVSHDHEHGVVEQAAMVGSLEEQPQILVHHFHQAGIVVGEGGEEVEGEATAPAEAALQLVQQPQAVIGFSIMEYMVTSATEPCDACSAKLLGPVQ